MIKPKKTKENIKAKIIARINYHGRIHDRDDVVKMLDVFTYNDLSFLDRTYRLTKSLVKQIKKEYVCKITRRLQGKRNSPIEQICERMKAFGAAGLSTGEATRKLAEALSGLNNV